MAELYSKRHKEQDGRCRVQDPFSMKNNAHLITHSHRETPEKRRFWVEFFIHIILADNVCNTEAP